MPLARGDIHDGGTDGEATPAGRPLHDAVVVAIAASSADRLRVAELLDGHAPVLLVASVTEALAVLGRQAAPASAAESGERRHPADSLRGILDSDRRTASWAGHTVSLSPLEHDVLACLLLHPGHTWTFAHLHAEVWGTTHLGSGSDVHSVVKRVRRKLRAIGSPLEIEAVRGVGLRLVQTEEPPVDTRPGSWIASQRAAATGVVDGAGAPGTDSEGWQEAPDGPTEGT